MTKRAPHVIPNEVRNLSAYESGRFLRGTRRELRLKQYYVYLMASFQQTLYIGVTNDLQRRIHEHKTKIHPQSFTARYNIDRLVYCETFNDVRDALAREKQIKSWRRSKKIALIEAENPRWKDLSLDWE